MNRTILAIGCVAVLAIGGVSSGCNSNPGSKQPSGTPGGSTTSTVQVPASPTPASTSTTASPASSQPSPSTPLSPGQLGFEGPLGFGNQPIKGTGRYWTEFWGYRYTFTVSTPGWVSNVKADVRVVEKDLGEEAMAGLFVLGPVGDLSRDACHWDGAKLIPGTSVDDLADALAATSGFVSSEPESVTLGGYSGKHIRLTVPADTDMSSCDDGEYHGIADFYAYSPGQVQDVWVLDLDGSRHTLFTTWEETAPRLAQHEVAVLVSRLEIEPAAP